MCSDAFARKCFESEGPWDDIGVRLNWNANPDDFHRCCIFSQDLKLVCIRHVRRGHLERLQDAD